MSRLAPALLLTATLVALCAAPFALFDTGCSPAAQQTEAALLTDGKVACATLLAGHPSADVVAICNLDAPTAALVQSGIRMANDVRDGGVVGAPEVASALNALIAEAEAARLLKPPDAGGVR